MVRALLCASLALVAISSSASAQLLRYPNPYLDYVYPAGGKQGQSITVELGGPGGLDGANAIVVDGPPGVTVSGVKGVNGTLVKATFTIAPDAPTGRRFVRVLGGANGLTNFRYFFVGNIPEVMEKEPNDTPATAQELSIPVVVNGRIEKETDIDCYRFHAKAGQRVVLAILAHGMDSVDRVRGFINGYVDTSLELLDEKGNILAAADDTVGLDPVLTHTFTTDGKYVVRVQSLGYKGSVSSVYRLTIGDVPYPTTAFPPGGRRGQEIDLELTGFNIDKPIRHKVKIPSDGSFPLYFLPPSAGPTSGFDLPLIRGDGTELLAASLNHDAKKAAAVAPGATVNGRIAKKGDEHWYRVPLKKGRPMVFNVTAQRHLRSPLDTLLEIFDSKGKKIAENDDGLLFAHPNQCAADFASADSWLSFAAPADGDYLVRLRDQGGAFGSQAVYRLGVEDSPAPFQLYQWPDAVPIWGPGTSASFLVELIHWGLTSDVALRIEGLPKGWAGSAVTLSASTFGIYRAPLGNRVLLTITAPANAAPGALAPFRVMGTTTHEGRVIEREAQYLTLYGNAHNDRMFLRSSPGARAVVANHMDAWPSTDVKELTVTHGETVKIPVRFERKAGGKRGPISVVINGPTVAANCGLGPPIALSADQDMVMVPLTISPRMLPGTRGIVIARSWSSDIRGGRPGPCTPLITLHVRAKAK